MRWENFIRSIVFLVLLLPGCRLAVPTPEVQQESVPSLEIAVVFPQVPVTKAGKELLASEAENKIHSLAIWVFRHEDHTPVGHPLFLNDEADFPPQGGIGRYRFDVDWNFVNTHPDVDVFVLANDASIGCTLDEDSTYDEIMDSDFGYTDDSHDLFGVSSYTTTVDENAGLPMSALKTGVKVYGSAPQLKMDALTLVRAVSRIRIVACKTHKEDGNDVVSIDGITFYKEEIPLREYVFSESAYRIGDTYNPADFSFGGVSSDDIKEHPVPEDLVYVNQDPDEYQDMLNQAVADETVTDLGYTYLRETDRRLIGRVNYTINGKSAFREFATSAKGDFARNHTWTLLAYFVSGSSLQVSLVADPWDKGDYAVDFSDQAITVTHKFRVDPNTGEITESGGFADVKLLPGTAAKGTLTITTPVGGILMIKPQGAANLFDVTPQVTIAPDKNGGEVTVEVRQHPNLDIDISELPESETTLTLSFWVSVNGREVSADSEVVDTEYRFHL